MPANDLHLHASATTLPASAGKPPAPATGFIDWDGLQWAGRACCCPAKPAVIVVMAPGPGRSNPTDLLLCGHHYRKSQSALAKAGAAVFDLAGAAVATDDRWLVGTGANRPS